MIDLTTKTDAELARMYIQFRDGKGAKKKEFDAELARYTSAMEKLEGEMRTRLADRGSESVKTPNGTFYKQVVGSATVSSRSELIQHIVESVDWGQIANDKAFAAQVVIDTADWSAIDIKANKTHVKKVLDETGELIPGTKYSAYEKVGVRRPS